MSELIKTYASNLTKILYNTEVLNNVKQNKRINPITVDINPTGYCNGGCQFCTQANMPRVNIDYELAKKGLRMYKEAGAVGLEITGGGEPMMYPQINELINYGKSLGYSIGMITNGTLIDKNLKKESMDKLTWLRVSLNPIYHKGLSLPKLPITYKGTYGANFVWEDGMNNDTLGWVKDTLNNSNFKYIKITPDVLSPKTNEMFNWLENELSNINLPIFVGGRTTFNSNDVSEHCYAGNLKPHINQDGKIYRCSCASWEFKKYPAYNVMADLHDDDFKVPVIPDNFDTSQCNVCHYNDLNGLIHLLLNGLDHGEFI